MTTSTFNSDVSGEFSIQRAGRSGPGTRSRAPAPERLTAG